jgi:predicted nuclease of restriction endonuclease-like RecB superfamily
VLTADLVRAKRSGGELVLIGMSSQLRERALAMAKEMLDAAALHVGRTREELELALTSVEASVREQRVKDGLIKLVSDRSDFGTTEELDPEIVRKAVFTRAASARRAAAPGAIFDRQSVLADAASELGAGSDVIERALFADLRGAQTLRAFDSISPAGLVAAYERGQAQAVLLRATKVVLTVTATSAGATRALFRRLKFLQLLYEIMPVEGGYRVVIDGPLSLFDAAIRYGQKLALVLSVLDGCEAYQLEAHLRWGKERTPLVFKLASTDRGASPRAQADEPPLSEEVEALLRAFDRMGGAWRAAPSRAILHLPGQGLSVPDLVFSRGKEKVYLEVMGYWSRDAVFRRIDLVERGMSERILFAVSSRLRVSEELLDDCASAALYVYKGTMSARAVAERLETLTGKRPRVPR